MIGRTDVACRCGDTGSHRAQTAPALLRDVGTRGARGAPWTVWTLATGQDARRDAAGGEPVWPASQQRRGAHRGLSEPADDGDLSDFCGEGVVYCIRNKIQLASVHESHRSGRGRGETQTKQGRW